MCWDDLKVDWWEHLRAVVLVDLSVQHGENKKKNKGSVTTSIIKISSFLG